MKVSSRASLMWIICSLCAGFVLPHPDLIAAEDAQAPYLNVTGAVVDAEGMPVAEATVSLVYSTAAQPAEVAHETTGEDGRFRFEVAARPVGPVAVVAWKRGVGCGLAKHESSFFANSTALPTGSTVELPVTLARPATLTLQVVAANGQPVAEGRVGVSALSSPDGAAAFYREEPLLAHLTREIDEDGRVTIDYLPAELGAGLLVETDGAGTQGFSIGRGRVADGATVELLPIATINVTLSAEDVADAQERKVIIESRPDRSADKPSQSPPTRVTPFRGVAVVHTDEDGTATAVVAAGTASVRVPYTPEARVFPEDPPPTLLQPGATADIEIKFESGVAVRGRVLADEEEPVAEVELTLVNATLRTDEDGRFEAWLPRSRQIYGRVVDVPAGFVWPYETYINVPRPTADDDSQQSTPGEIELPIIRVKRATPVSGAVVDQAGKPLAGVDVHAAWVQTHDVHTYFTRKSDVAQTDSEGRFELEHVLSNTDVRIIAQTSEAATKSATIIHTSEAKTVQLEVTPAGMVKLAGRVQGSDGAVIKDAQVKIVRALVAPGGHNYGTRPVEFHGSRLFPADEQGLFQSPGALPRFGQYSLTISAPGYLAVETSFLTPPESGPVMELPQTILTKARTATGVVVDAAGNPLADVVVGADAAPSDGGRHQSQRSQATTNTSGRFALDRLHPRAALAIAEKDGYRTGGSALLVDQPEVKITLFRTDEKAPEEHRIRPVWETGRRHEAARKLLAEIIPQRRNSNYFYGQLVEMLLRIDRHAAVLETTKSTSPSIAAKVLAKLGEIDDALAEAETISNDDSRAFAKLSVLDHVDDPDQARDLLAAVLVDAELIRRPDRRLFVVANVADHFAQLGDTTHAEQVLRSALSQAQSLSTTEWPGFARASFAERLAQFDAELALEIVREADPDDQARHFQNIAHALAAAQPDVAVAALDSIKEHRYVDSPVVRVAYRMAPVDLPRALQLLERIDHQQRPTEKSRGLGVIAYAAKDLHSQRARELLQQAFDSLPEQRGAMGSRADDIFGAAITLLRFAEEIDPEHLTDYYWQALKTCPGPSGGAWRPEDAEEEDADRQAQLALLLSLYGHPPGLLAQIMEPVFAYWEEQIGADPGRFADREATFMAMAMTDPQRAVDWALRFDDQLDEQLRRRIPQPWEVIGNTLTYDRWNLGQAITREVFHRWVIDQYDL